MVTTDEAVATYERLRMPTPAARAELRRAGVVLPPSITTMRSDSWGVLYALHRCAVVEHLRQQLTADDYAAFRQRIEESVSRHRRQRRNGRPERDLF